MKAIGLFFVITSPMTAGKIMSPNDAPTNMIDANDPERLTYVSVNTIKVGYVADSPRPKVIVQPQATIEL